MADAINELLVTDIAAEKPAESERGAAHLGVLGRPPAGHADAGRLSSALARAD